MASIAHATNDTEASAETISDIQNYLQSFNKEIGEASTNDAAATTTFYTIDTSQVLGASGNTEDALSATANTTTVATTDPADGTGYQTLALVPDSAGGGYVLIVQPTAGQAQGQVQIPVTGNASPIVTTGSQSISLPSGISVAAVTSSLSTSAAMGVLTADCEPKNDKRNSQLSSLTRIKKEKSDSEKQNDISVYDFDDVNPPQTQELEDECEDEEERDINEGDDLDQSSIGDMKPILGTPKNKRIAKKSPGSIAKKSKMCTPTSTPGQNQHMCNYCNYTSSKRYLLSRHMKSHSEERPHKCGICERGFKTIASLQNHVNTHTGVRPHGCKYCEAAFTTS
ncbi:Zinc-finger double domain containing protein 12-like protein, partial [Leptotrombidium deliense]